MLTQQKNKKNNLGSNMKSHIRKEFAEVARELGQVKKKKKNKKPKGALSLNRVNSMSRDFACALKLPFHPCAVGCRVPDIYSAPTSTYHVRGNVVLGTTTAGTLGVIVLPNPILSLVDTALDSNNTACVTSGMTQITTTSGAGTSPYYGAVGKTPLSLAMASYRVASWGLKITSTQPALSGTGRLYIALIPSISQVPNIGTVENNGCDNGNGHAGRAFTNLQPVFSSSILDYPEATMLTVSELMTGAVCITPSPVNPIFYNFKSLTEYPTINNGYYVNDQTSTNSAGAVFGARNGMNINNVSGGMTVVIFGDGFPTSLTNAVDIEFVYHLEGTPLLSISNSAGLSSVSPMQHAGSTDIVEKALQIAPASQGISFLTEVEQMGALASKGFNAAKDFSQTPLGGAMASALMALF